MVEVDWRIDLLGGVSARRDGQVRVKLPTQLTSALLGYLAYHKGRDISRELLLTLLWKDDDPALSRNRLNQLLFQLRAILEPEGIPKGTILRTSRLSVTLSDAVATDVADFTDSLAKTEEPTAKAETLRQALNFYRGEFMAGCHLDWVYAVRQEWADRFVESSREAAALFRKAGRLEEALRISQSALELDTLDEVLHRDVIETHLAMHQPAKGLRQFRELERILAEELGIAPSGASQMLSRRLQTIEETDSTKQRIRIETSPPSSPSLPQYATGFFGRSKELDAIQVMLGHHRQVALIGPGGIGKTRLGIEALDRLRVQTRAAVWFVGLQDIEDPGLIAPRVREVLEADAQLDPYESIRLRLVGEPNPIILVDNLEQFGQDIGEMIHRLLGTSPTLRLIATSRHSLFADAMSELAIQPLDTPKSSKRTARELAQVPSVQVFLDRARMANPNFQITQLRAETIARIAEKLDGIPLAIELAAAWTAELTVGQILDRLNQKLDLLVTTKRDSPERHRTLRATLDHSFNLLRPDLQKLFARLSVFRGGWSLEAAEAVCGPQKFVEMAELRKRSFISIEMPSPTVESLGLGSRYHMLETMREYGRERLAADETVALQALFDRFFLRFAAEAEPALRGSRQGQWIAKLAADNDNLIDVIDRSIERADQNTGFTLVARLWRYWYFSGRWDQGVRHIEGLFSSLKERKVDTPEKTEAAIALGFLYISMGKREIARQWFEDALTNARSAESGLQIAACLNGLGCVSREFEDYGRATTYYQEALDVASGLGDAYLHAAIAGNLAEIYAYRREWAEGRKAYRTSFQLWSELGTHFYMALSLLHWAHCDIRLDREPGAIRQLKKAVTIVRKMELLFMFGWTMAEVALVACASRNFEDAAMLLGAAKSEAVANATLRPADPINVNHADAVEMLRQELKSALSKSVIGRLTAQGAGLPLDEVFDLAERVLRRSPPQVAHIRVT